MKNIFVALFAVAMLAVLPVAALAIDGNRPAIWTIEKAMQQGKVTTPAYGGGGQYFASREGRISVQQADKTEATTFSGLYVPR